MGGIEGLNGLVFAISLNIISIGVVALAFQYWKKRKADAEEEADNDFEFLRSVQKRYGFSNYNLSRMCYMYYNEYDLPPEKRRDSEAVYISYSFYLAEKLYNSKDEKDIEIEIGLNSRVLSSKAYEYFRKANSAQAFRMGNSAQAKANIVDYILTREHLYSIRQHAEAFEAFINRYKGVGTVSAKPKVTYSTEEYQNYIKELCDSNITNPKCLLLQMENK